MNWIRKVLFYNLVIIFLNLLTFRKKIEIIIKNIIVWHFKLIFNAIIFLSKNLIEGAIEWLITKYFLQIIFFFFFFFYLVCL